MFKLRASLLILVALILAIFPYRAAALSDTTPPEVKSIMITPSSVDVSTAPSSATVTVNLADTSGITEYYFCFASPTGTGDCYGSTRNAPNCAILVAQKDYACTVAVPINAHSPGGEWKINAISATDILGNRSYLNNDGLVSRGLQNSFNVTSDVVNDSSAPSIDSINITPGSVDVTTLPSTVVITAQVSDQSGVSAFSLCIASPIGTGDCLGSERNQPNCTIVVAQTQYSCSMQFTIPAHAPGGEWKISQIQTRDIFGNHAIIVNDDLSDTDLSSSFQVTSGLTESDAPTLKSLSIYPNSIDVTTSPAFITVSVELSDQTGVSEYYFCYENPAHNGDCYGSSRNAPNCVIVLTQNEYKCTVVILVNAHSPGGEWKVNVVSAFDIYSNRTYLSDSDLSSAGFSNTFQVISDN